MCGIPCSASQRADRKKIKLVYSYNIMAKIKYNKTATIIKTIVIHVVT